jgi:sugar phosphate isomerase/epimerase
MALNRNDLVLCGGTLASVPFLDRLAPAYVAGYAGVSMLTPDYLTLEAEGITPKEIVSRIADHGLQLAEFDAVLTWLPEHGAEASMAKFGFDISSYTAETMCPVAESIGAGSITVVETYGTEVDVDIAAEYFARVCDIAAAHGLRVHLEFTPIGGIADLSTAWDIVSAADRPNGGITIDSWHFFRSGSKLDYLSRLPGDRFFTIQLNDAPAEPAADLLYETVHSRLLPGKGAIDLVGIVRALDGIGCDAPIGVEVFSDELTGVPAVDVAEQTISCTRALLAEARHN